MTEIDCQFFKRHKHY